MSSSLGQDWTWYAPHNAQGQMNIVSRPAAVIASRLLHLLLTDYGSSPLHPTLGLAPKLFVPLTDRSAKYFQFHAREEILQWNQAAKIGITSLAVELEPQTVYRNDITINIGFTSEAETQINVLTFGYWAYTGAAYDQGLKTFRDGVTLNGQPFPYFTDPPSEYLL
jgi:hypothetical protein